MGSPVCSHWCVVVLLLLRLEDVLGETTLARATSRRDELACLESGRVIARGWVSRTNEDELANDEKRCVVLSELATDERR